MIKPGKMLNKALTPGDYCFSTLVELVATD